MDNDEITRLRDQLARHQAETECNPSVFGGHKVGCYCYSFEVKIAKAQDEQDGTPGKRVITY